MASSINNMNILTLITEIFQTLKNLDSKYYTLQNTLTSEIGNIGTALTSISESLASIQSSLQIIDTNISKQSHPILIPPELENELKQHITTHDKVPRKLQLAPSEHTIANLIENDYTVADINGGNDSDPVATLF
jgi:chromosome segregation ATPase